MILTEREKCARLQNKTSQTSAKRKEKGQNCVNRLRKKHRGNNEND